MPESNFAVPVARHRDVLSAEEEFLLAAAKVDPPPEEIQRLQRIVIGEFSWERLQAVAEQLHLHTLLAHNIQAIPSLAQLVPAAVGTALAEQLTDSGEALSAYLSELSAPLQELERTGVRYVVLKGVALIASVYPWGTRWIYDIDVLIAPEEFEDTARILQAHGFEKRLARRFQREEDQRAAYHEMTFERPWRDSAVRIDLHWSLCAREKSHLRSTSRTGLYLPFRFETHEILAAAVPATLLGFRIWIPPPEMLFVHGATQLAADRFASTLVRAGDFYALVRRGLDWPRLCELTERTQTVGVVHLALGAAALLGAPAPAEVARDIGRRRPGCRLATRLLADPRWLVGRWKAPTCAALFLRRLIAPRNTELLLDPFVAPVRAFRDSRQAGFRPWRALMRTSRLMAMSVAWGIAALVAEFLEALPVGGLGASLRGRLWKQLD